jgi:pyruvate dehydrogenase (quinone)
MAQTVGDFLVERLHQWGVRILFGYPGDGINGVFGALNRADKKIEFVQARHEEMAALMACGYAKFTGKVGVCVATSGPGAIHLLNGLYDAKMDHQPVVAIVGQAATSAIGGSYQQEVDLPSLFKDVASEYVHTAMNPAQVRFLVDRAFRTAASERCPTCIIVPKDVQEMDAVETPAHPHDTLHSSAGFSPPRILPAESEIRRAADVLNAGAKVAILVGAGARNAVDEVLLVQDLVGGGIAKALLGIAVVPDDLPFVTGPIGLLGTKPSWDMIMGCDTLLMVGSSFPYSEFLPKEGKARGVQQADRHPLPDGGEPRRRRQAHARRSRSVPQAQVRPLVGRDHPEERRRVVASHGGPRAPRGQADQPAESLLVVVPQAACEGDPLVGRRLVRQLVRSRSQDEASDASERLRLSRDDGMCGALRDRREIRAP